MRGFDCPMIHAGRIVRYLATTLRAQGVEAAPPHVPVMKRKVIEALRCGEESSRGRIFVDGTFGCGGHSAAILGMSPSCCLQSMGK